MLNRGLGISGANVMGRYSIVWALALLLQALAAFAQQSESANITFGGLRGDPSQPVTVTSQTLTVDEAQNSAVFSGDVLVVQGEMRLSADEVRVEYDISTARIARLWAKGDVLLVNAKDAAQSQTAEYLVDTGQVIMRGDVVLTQGPATFSAGKLSADLTTGLGKLEGGVRSTFTPSTPGKAAP